jgi:hypothetical protein
MAALDLDEERWPVSGEELGGAAQHRQLVALDVDLDERDATRYPDGDVVEPPPRDLDGDEPLRAVGDQAALGEEAPAGLDRDVEVGRAVAIRCGAGDDLGGQTQLAGRPRK